MHADIFTRNIGLEQGGVYFFSCYTYAKKFRFDGSRVVGWFLWVGEVSEGSRRGRGGVVEGS